MITANARWAYFIISTANARWAYFIISTANARWAYFISSGDPAVAIMPNLASW